MNIGDKIYELRKRDNLSQEQLAEKLEVSRQIISKWELSETLPDIKQAKKISQLFNISLDELVNTNNEEKNYEDIWKSILTKIKDNKTLLGYLEIAKFINYQHNFICVSFPHVGVAKKLKEEYGELLLNCAKEEDPEIEDIKFLVIEHYYI